jgi:SAM-dependent methyltransferase
LQLRTDAYSYSAAFYDRMVGRYAFEQWKENFERLGKRYDLDASRTADVACGTGLASRYLDGQGAEVYAFDISLQMLREAAKASSGGRGPKLLRQDMRYLLPPVPVPLLICATDSLNHLLREDDIRRTIKAFYAALYPGGHALFDMNSAWQLREGSDSEPWEFEVEGARMRWVSAWSEKDRTATLELAFFGAGKNGKEVTEVHRERAYSPEWVLEVLGRAGFGRAEVLDAAGLGKVSERTRRFQFVACR